MNTYYVIHKRETGCDVKVKKCYSEEDVRYYVKQHQLGNKYTLIEGGNIIKEAA